GTLLEIAGYSVLSNGGMLAPDQFSGLQDQAAANWQEATPTASALSELYDIPNAGYAVDATPINLGAVFAGPNEFGTSPDVAFEYVTSDNQVVQGLVEYSGTKAANNLELIVDPESGAALLRNSSDFTISLSGYSILSESGALRPAEDDWSSLASQGLSGWDEAAPTTDALSELVSSGATELNPGRSFSLGELFTVAGEQDLTLEFYLDGESQFRNGIVSYVSLRALPGDFDGNGTVDGADFVLWQRDASVGELADWEANFGTSAAAASVASVPEPAAMGLILLALAPLYSTRRRRSI
ncbi:MAG: PEP-CTERM sorting domain-containing protein, partial [Planctomycetota bacterium]